MDSIIIVCSNALFESIAAFAVFGVIGFLGITPDPQTRLGSFDIGFRTLPLAITEMPGANFWAVALFFTLMVLGFSSAFAMLDAVVTLVMDTGVKWARWKVVTGLVLLSFACSLPYCTQFGTYLLDGIDRWINDVALIFVVWAECVTSTTVYRWKDLVNQVRAPAFIVYNIGFFGAMVFGTAVAQVLGPEAGAGMAFGLFIAGSILSVLIARTPDLPAPRFWGKITYTSKFWYLAFYSVSILNSFNLIYD